MKLKRIIATCILAGMSLAGFAQTNVLDGNWKRETVSVVKSSDKSAVDVSQFKDNSYFCLYEELAFQAEELTITVNGYQMKGQAKISKTKMLFSFTPAPTEVEYKIRKGILSLTQRVSFQNENYIVSITYKKQ